MKQVFSTLTILFLSFGVFAQGTLCEGDTLTSIGILTKAIIDDSQSAVTIRMSNSDEVYNAKRLCQHSYEAIDSLNNRLTEEQVEDLFNCENIALKAVSFILFCKRNSKSKAIIRFKKLLEGRTGFISSGCSDATSIISYQQFCLEVLNQQNLVFHPEYNLTREEKEQLTEALLKYEKDYWNK